MKHKLLTLFLMLGSFFVLQRSQAQTCTGEVLNISASTPSINGTTDSWTVPTGGPYKVKITTKGAVGGGKTREQSNVGGRGATMIGEFIVSSGQILQAIAGAPGQSNEFTGGGGGGSGVQIQVSATLLVLAGGGGGAGSSFLGAGLPAAITNSGTNGGGAGKGGGGGGGYIGNGQNSSGRYSGGGGGGGFNGIGGFGSGNTGFGGGGFGSGGGGGHTCDTNGDCLNGGNFSGGGGGGYTGGYGGGGWNGGGGGGSYNLGSNQNNTAGANNGGGQVIIECLGTASISATVTPTQPICTSPTQGSVSINLTGDLNGNISGGVEYAIVSGNSFTGTPTFADVTADPFNVTAGTGTAVGTYTVRVRLKYNPTVFVDQVYVLASKLTGTIYVRANANGANNGSSWADAFTSLQDALAAACSGAQIWVAKGTYYPTTNPTDRSATFVMKNGVAIYGGFAGSETNLNERNWTNNPTILSGEIQQDNDVSNNSYHVINSGGLNSTALLDGFIITGGNADGGWLDSYGGGMYSSSSSHSVTNCRFSGNQAKYGGGGMYNSSSSPSLMNCSFSGNQVSTGGGGGMCNSYSSYPSLRSCSFSGNQASYGGGMFNLERSSPSLTNCSFSGNQAIGYGGGGVYNSDASFPNLTNCSFSGNQASFGGGIYNGYVASSSLYNCIVWGNSGEVLDDDSNLYSSTFTNTLVKGLTIGGFQGTEDPLFVNAAGGDLRLQPCSPAINAGNPASTSATVGNVDLAGNPRFFNGSRVDLGAYEYQGTLFAATARSNSPVCIGGLLNLSATGGSTYSWVGPNGYNSGQQNPTRSNATTSISGVYSVTVSEGVCTATASTSVQVQQSQGSANLSSNSPVCAGSALNLSATGGSAYTWAGPGGYNSTQQNPRLTSAGVTMSGTYSGTVRSGVGCISTGAVSVIVSPNVAPSITSLRVNGNLPSAQTNTAIACTNAPVTLTVAATNAVTYSWRGPTGAGSGFTSSLASPVEMPIASPRQGQYTVTVRNGCQVFNQRVLNLQLINCSNTRLANTEAIEMEINAYPNPVSKTLKVEVRLKEPAALQLKLLNSLGQPSGTWQLGEVSDCHQTELNLADLQGGMYLLEAQAGSQRAVKKILKE